jgi:hypothetical protein
MKRAFLLVFVLVAALNAHARGSIIIRNADPAGTGFNDPTPVMPVGGNDGTTLGQQRLNVFQRAADRWASVLRMDVSIVVFATFGVDLECSETAGVLGSASPASWQRDFAAAPRAETWYPIALANELSGRDLNGAGVEIVTRFNRALDNQSCLGSSDWYYGFDHEEGDDVDLYQVVMHELGHGLGISGADRSPKFDSNRPAIADVYTYDLTLGRSWAQMSLAERSTSLTNTGKLVWTGDNVRDHAKSYLTPTMMLSISEPSPVARNYDIGTAAFGPSANTTRISGKLVRVADAANPDGPTTTDGCTPFTNAAAIAGNVAFVDRGTCPYVTKVRNAQAAGATGVVVADHTRQTCQPPSMGGEAADIMIPAVSVGANDADLLKAQLSAGADVRGLVQTDPTQLAGASKESYVRLYAPCTDEPGSSTRHWDVAASPDLLMEPFISGDLKHGLDLTLYQLMDIGWPLAPRTGRGVGRGRK